MFMQNCLQRSRLGDGGNMHSTNPFWFFYILNVLNLLLISKFICHYCQTAVGCSWLLKSCLVDHLYLVEYFLIYNFVNQTVNIYWCFHCQNNFIYRKIIAFVYILNFADENYEHKNSDFHRKWNVSTVIIYTISVRIDFL